MQIEMQEKADQTQAEDQQRHEHDKIELYRALEEQQDRLMRRLGTTEKQIEVNDVKTIERLDSLDNRIKIM